MLLGINVGVPIEELVGLLLEAGAEGEAKALQVAACLTD